MPDRTPERTPKGRSDGNGTPDGNGLLDGNGILDSLITCDMVPSWRPERQPNKEPHGANTTHRGTPDRTSGESPSARPEESPGGRPNAMPIATPNTLLANGESDLR